MYGFYPESNGILTFNPKKCKLEIIKYELFPFHQKNCISSAEAIEHIFIIIIKKLLLMFNTAEQ